VHLEIGNWKGILITLRTAMALIREPTRSLS
jgi:hypothetical protein